MPHIHTQPGQHDLTTSAYIVRTDGQEPVLLMHFHRRLHKWMQFGGHVELHENIWQGLAHEIEEESGYKLTQLKLLQPDMPRLEYTGDAVVHPLPASIVTAKIGELEHFHTDVAYGFVVAEDPAGTVDKDESSEFRAFSRNELAKLGPDECPPNVQKVALMILDNYSKSWKQIDASQV
jgi:8-oxo-dGTP diphosphatase